MSDSCGGWVAKRPNAGSQQGPGTSRCPIVGSNPTPASGTTKGDPQQGSPFSSVPCSHRRGYSHGSGRRGTSRWLSVCGAVLSRVNHTGGSVTVVTRRELVHRQNRDGRIAPHDATRTHANTPPREQSATETGAMKPAHRLISPRESLAQLLVYRQGNAHGLCC